jgi:hypothetical protein
MLSPVAKKRVFLLLSATEPALVTADRPHRGESGRQRVPEETKSFPVQAAWWFPLENLGYLWGPCPLGLELYSENPGPINCRGRCRVLRGSERVREVGEGPAGSPVPQPLFIYFLWLWEWNLGLSHCRPTLYH